MTILSTIMGVESGGGHNVTQGNIGDINNRTGDLAQGYYQITGGTWAEFGGSSTGYSSAIQAPYASQLQVAENIPVNRWGPATITQLGSQGYHALPGETLGQMLQRYGENPAATVPADGGGTLAGDGSNHSSGIAAGSGAGSTAGPAIDPATGMPASQTDTASNSSGKEGDTYGASVNLGLQKSLVGDIEGWISQVATDTWQGVWKSVSSTFLNIQNWFIRAFVIIVGLVILAIGLIKVTGTEDKIYAMVGAAARA